MLNVRFYWETFLKYLILIAMLIFVSQTILYFVARTNYFGHLETQLQQDGYVLKETLLSLDTLSKPFIDTLIHSMYLHKNIVVTLINKQGTLIFDSQDFHNEQQNTSSSNTPNLLYKSEIQLARDHNEGISYRFSATHNQEMIYWACHIQAPQFPIAYIRLGQSYQLHTDYVADYLYWLPLIALVLIIIGLMYAFGISYQVWKPTDSIIKACNQYASGNYSYIIPIETKGIFGSLTQALNAMARRLKYQMDEFHRKEAQLTMIIESMNEGLVAIDEEATILLINRVFKQTMGLQGDSYENRMLPEMVRNAAILRLMEQAMKQDVNIITEKEIEIGHQILNFYTRPIMDYRGNRFGSLMIFHDVTREKQLEKMRKQFVANVSHEMRTPLTSIMGYVETIQDGVDEEQRTLFLNKIHTNTVRLNAIIEDLLLLAKLESGKTYLEFNAINPISLVEQAISNIEKKASEKNSTIKKVCDDTEVSIKANVILLEQALLNVLDNAIKYSPNDTCITITCFIASRKEYAIQIADQGFGISEKYLDRIFERFYRVDKGRSRELGGTGLGLSIVKHTMNIHQGRITVKSEEHKGSVFTLFFPLHMEDELVIHSS